MHFTCLIPGRTHSQFTASKCDDISCSEVIRALNLEDDPELEEIEGRIDQYADETNEWKKKKTVAEKLTKSRFQHLSATNYCLIPFGRHRC
jgi:hypothetical protein